MKQWRLQNYVTSLADVYGQRFVTLLFVNYYAIKGLVMILVGSTMLPFFKELGADGVQYELFNIIVFAPFAMKGLIGAMSDAWPFGRYHKRNYMITYCLAGFIAMSLVVACPYSIFRQHLWLPPVLLAVVILEVAALDLLIEGRYTEAMRESPATGASLVTFVWMSYTLGSLTASALVGPIADIYGTRPLFILALPFTIVILPLLLFNFLPEEVVPKESRNRINVAKIRKEAGFFSMAVATAVGALMLSFATLFYGSKVQTVVSLGSSVGLVILAYQVLPRELANCNFYMYSQDALYISIKGTLDFWYTASPECVPDGPHFDYTYYSTYTAWVSSLASMAGLWLFQRFMKNWPIRFVFWLSVVLRLFASLFDLIIVKRWNRLIGINDKVMYMLGDAIIYDITYMLNFMPGVLLTAKLCPRNMESTVYAILAGFANFGRSTARSLGAVVQNVIGVRTNAPYCNFDKLPMLITVGHAALPALCLPLVFILLPNQANMFK